MHVLLIYVYRLTYALCYFLLDSKRNIEVFLSTETSRQDGNCIYCKVCLKAKYRIYIRSGHVFKKAVFIGANRTTALK